MELEVLGFLVAWGLELVVGGKSSRVEETSGSPLEVGASELAQVVGVPWSSC